VTNVYVPEDLPAGLLRDHLKTFMVGRYPSLTFDLRLDASWSAADSVPALVVFDDSGPVRWPVETRPTLRVAVWSDSLPKSREIASYALGTALCRRVDSIAKILPGTAVLDSRDTDNGGIVAGFTVRTRIRTTLIVEP
jgi:hypothetical protein